MPLFETPKFARHPCHSLKNAEMLFNFGDQPWKHQPLEGYVGFAKAPAKNIIANSKSGQTQERKLVNNAPQALIIEPSRELADQTYNQIKQSPI
jgi:ATP-dependent RNA helicase DDX1